MEGRLCSTRQALALDANCLTKDKSRPALGGRRGEQASQMPSHGPNGDQTLLRGAVPPFGPDVAAIR